MAQSKLTDREKVSHLLRRFGLGAGRYQRKPYEQMGYERTLADLLYDDTKDEQFPISPWEFATLPTGKVESNAYHLNSWWALRFMLTKRPFQEKLTLFWHDHFAIDIEKVGEITMVHGYLETIRKHGRGKFRDLLSALFKQGAIYIYLDNHASNRLRPNENFARELFELFTMGEGNYSEEDIRETARALTGWSTHYLGTGFQMPYEQLREMAAKNKLGLINVCYTPAVHDEGNKTILGITKNWDADQVIAHLASHPKTAHYICSKLWEWYAYPNPSETVINRLTKVWSQTDGNIRAVIKAIAESPEFWSAQCVLQKHKSPVDFVISIYRSLDLSEEILKLREEPKTEFTSIKKEIRDLGGGLHYLMSKQGLTLLLPPDVAGWDWGPAWITTQTMLERIKLTNTVFYAGGAQRTFAMRMANMIKRDDNPNTNERLIDAFADVLDVQLSSESRTAMLDLCNRGGGVNALNQPNSAANLFAALGRVVFGSPNYHLC